MTKKSILPEAVKYLVSAGHKAPSPDNSQPWLFLWDGKTLSLEFDINRAKKIFGPDSHATLLTMGAVLENLALAEETAGLDTRWESAKRAGEYIRIHLDADTKIPEKAWNHPLFARHTNRAPSQRKALPSPLLEQLAKIKEGEATLRVFCEKPHIMQIAGLVKIASEMRFQTRELHEWLGESLRFSPSEVSGGDGLDIATLALPIGGRALLHLIKEWKRMAFLNHVGAYRILAAIEAENIRKAPVIVAVVSPKRYEAGLDAGRVMERAWIILNQNKVAVQPYYVVSDQLIRLMENEIPSTLHIRAEKLLRQKNSIFGEQTVIHMLLRVGYPKHCTPTSLRLPLESVWANKTGVVV